MNRTDQVEAIIARTNALSHQLEDAGEDAWPLTSAIFSSLISDYLSVYSLAVETLKDEIAAIHDWPAFDLKQAQAQTLEQLGADCNAWLTVLNAFYLVKSFLEAAKREEN